MKQNKNIGGLSGGTVSIFKKMNKENAWLCRARIETLEKESSRIEELTKEEDQNTKVHMGSFKVI